MAKALAPPVAGRADAVLSGSDQVVEVGAEPALLDHRGPLGGRPLVVDPVRPPLAGQATIVEGVQVGGRDPLAHLACVDRGALLDVVGLQAVAGHLVEQHPAEAPADHHGHRAGRRRVGVEQGERDSRRPLGGALGGPLGDQLEAAMPAECLEPGLHRAVSAGDNLDPEPHPGSVVDGEPPLGVGHRDPPAALRVAGLHLGDLVARRAGRFVAGAKQLRLALGRHPGGGDGDLLERRRLGRRQGLGLATVSARRVRHGGRGALQLALPQAVHVGEVSRLAANHPHPGAALAAALHPLHPRLVDRQAEPGALLAEDLGEVAAALKRALQHPAGKLGLDQRRGLIITPEPVPRGRRGGWLPNSGMPGICGKPSGSLDTRRAFSTTLMLTTAGLTSLATLIKTRDRSEGAGNCARFCCAKTGALTATASTREKTIARAPIKLFLKLSIFASI